MLLYTPLVPFQLKYTEHGTVILFIVILGPRLKCTLSLLKNNTWRDYIAPTQTTLTMDNMQ